MIDIKTGKEIENPAVLKAPLAGPANASVGGAARGMMRNVGARTAANLGDAKQYVQDGLIAHWDGLDISDSIWRDKIGGLEIDISQTTVDNGVKLVGGIDIRPSVDTGWTASTFGGYGKSGTFEVCARFEEKPSSNSYTYILSIGQEWSYNAICFWHEQRGLFLSRNMMLGLKPYVIDHTGEILPIKSLFTLTGRSNGSGLLACTFLNGEPKTYTTGNYCNVNTYSPLIFGGNCKGTWHSIRIYNRPLTDDEIASNHSIDVERFGIS